MTYYHSNHNSTHDPLYLCEVSLESDHQLRSCPDKENLLKMTGHLANRNFVILTAACKSTFDPLYACEVSLESAHRFRMSCPDTIMGRQTDRQADSSIPPGYNKLNLLRLFCVRLGGKR
ncbi:hypothetical protein CI610_03113 [invertebrate metagenome]|uniref:Uncharacterized protein n=1 Tax=invertebrate metagenome TaxID=1711999 RepID=A0A2H9T3Z5_9ZZZZ